MRRRARTRDVEEEEEEEERGGGEVDEYVTCQETAAERRAAIGDHNQEHNRGEPSERSADRAGSEGGGTRDFRALMLDEQIVKGLEEAGYIRPSPVQLRAIPLGNMGLDLIVQAKSGTGKTCVFAVIILQSLSLNFNGVQALVLSHTRELAYQTRDVIRSVARFMSGIRCEAFVGGLPTEKDIEKLKSAESCQIVAGRLRALVEAKHLDLSALRQLVLDEVDVLLEEEGLRPQVEFFFKVSPPRKQILAVSATFTDELLAYLHARLSNPQVVNVIRANVALKGVKQFVEFVESPRDVSDVNAKMERRMMGLVRVLESTSFHQCIVFTNSRTLGQRVCLLLERLGFPSSFTCGDLPQPERLRALEKLRNFEIRV
ncbi:hypothetical protein GUITHDRAFT_135872 [Guillardia theta CCMP2712]|uniref:RNA helicase n=1 Tax=Guillardia theta (strain CCMP2712) TaxID=905079 RepID=L1JND5_GUITC|nr:hypothetical protein GUITHDRAFT_135872 [Guillardia theta CCMP2712]EKX49705.1 hypothetical protein GUITHDRAFT_135872 [Guillardia theta CCMP2712]|eukprot:XP_005836685.1 hypothetical protein GUITHDRAFT_135872 [Guillardia theta CCMP2712]